MSPSIKPEVIGALEALVGLAEQVGLETLAEELRSARIPKVSEERWSLVVLGEFNHGKTTFVNRLLGDEVLPVGVTPTTAALTHVIWGETPAARVVLCGGGEERLDPGRIGEWITDGENARRAQFVELAWPAPLLRDRVTLVDTPGVNDISEQRAEITYGYVPRADAVVFLLDAGQILKESERTFLEQRVLARCRDKIVFAVAKADTVEPAELRQAVAYAQGHLGRIIPEPRVYPISAKTGLGLAPFIAEIERMLAGDRARVLLDHALGDGLRTAAFIGQSLGLRRRSLDLGIEDLEARVARVRQHLEVSARLLRAHEERARAEADAIKAIALSDLEEFRAAFVQALPAEIDAASAGDLKRYLQPYIQDTFKDWLEREGEKVGDRLERLAEEIISLTNENVKEALETLQATFGAAHTSLKLEVDTLKYDVGVFALGAFGTTIFFFVNTLVGSLLTLAAPLLAVAIRSKVERETKDQAKERAPEVIDRATVALGPKLAATIDQFADRLQDFIAAAGSTLARSVEQVLEQALVERRAAGDSADPVRLRLDAQEEALRKVEGTLNELRERLWREPG